MKIDERSRYAFIERELIKSASRLQALTTEMELLGLPTCAVNEAVIRLDDTKDTVRGIYNENIRTGKEF